jgi:hypothetical protein
MILSPATGFIPTSMPPAVNATAGAMLIPPAFMLVVSMNGRAYLIQNPRLETFTLASVGITAYAFTATL